MYTDSSVLSENALEGISEATTLVRRLTHPLPEVWLGGFPIKTHPFLSCTKFSLVPGPARKIGRDEASKSGDVDARMRKLAEFHEPDGILLQLSSLSSSYGSSNTELSIMTKQFNIDKSMKAQPFVN